MRVSAAGALLPRTRLTVEGSTVGVTLERQGRDVGPPVLLVPGLGASPAPFWLHGRRSLVATLQAAGHTPWTVDFGLHWRGKGQGVHAVLHALEVALAELRRHAGVDLDEVGAVGHSLGGILLLALLADDVPLRRAVCLASGLDYRLGRSPLPRLLSLSPKGLRPLRLPDLGGGLPLRGLARVGAGAFGRGLKLPVERDQFHPGTTDAPTLRAAVRAGVRDIPWALLLDLADLFTERGPHVGQAGYPLRAAVGRIDRPVLFVAARQDRQCPLDSVRDAARRVPGAALVEVGGDGAPGEGYGHLDLLTGQRAPEEVFDPVVAFLDAPDGAP